MYSQKKTKRITHLFLYLRIPNLVIVVLSTFRFHPEDYEHNALILKKKKKRTKERHEFIGAPLFLNF